MNTDETRIKTEEIFFFLSVLSVLSVVDASCLPLRLCAFCENLFFAVDSVYLLREIASVRASSGSVLSRPIAAQPCPSGR